ncbi:flagellar export protein FliJ [Lutibacter sp. B2]|nr:flagellar export protein FliJ [Lutibacter sp. B2]
MNKFCFKYENIIDIKCRYEDIAKGKLNEAQQRLIVQEKELEHLKSQSENYKNYINEIVSEGTSAGTIMQCNSFLEYYRTNIELQGKRIEECKHEVAKRRHELMKVSQAKKVLEKLKEKEKENFLVIEKKEEMDFIDGLVTFKNFQTK